MVQLVGGNWVTNYFAPDATGSIRLVLDDSGQITDAQDFDAFGNILRRMGTTDFAMGWQGEYRDSDTGLIYLRARWYNPDQDRFMEMDAFEGVRQDPRSLNKYNAFENDGVDNSDPLGLFIDASSAGAFSSLASSVFPNSRTLIGNPAARANAVAEGSNERYISSLDVKFQEWAREHFRLLRQAGLHFIITFGYRSIDEQNKLYAIGRTTQLSRGHVTDLKGGDSWHNYGLAYDIVRVDENGHEDWKDGPDYTKAGRLGEGIGLLWGGNWADPHDIYHFQYPLKLKEIKRRYQAGEPFISPNDEPGTLMDFSNYDFSGGG
jgi:RHS repeat-associated protein